MLGKDFPSDCAVSKGHEEVSRFRTLAAAAIVDEVLIVGRKADDAAGQGNLIFSRIEAARLAVLVDEGLVGAALGVMIFPQQGFAIGIDEPVDRLAHAAFGHERFFGVEPCVVETFARIGLVFIRRACRRTGHMQTCRQCGQVRTAQDRDRCA